MINKKLLKNSGVKGLRHQNGKTLSTSLHKNTSKFLWYSRLIFNYNLEFLTSLSWSRASYVSLSISLVYCAVPDKIHTHPLEGHWKFLGEGGS